MLLRFTDQLLRNLYIVQFTSLIESEPCALTHTDHGIHFENLHARAALDGRRQKIPKGSMSIVSMIFGQHGPKISKHYNPTYGYEPYWPEGDWVFGAAANKTTKGFTNELCGQNCPEMFKRYGKVCGRDKKFKHKTFDNYCDLISEDCTLRSGWLIAYRGECQAELKLYPNKSVLIPDRAAAYISKFEYEHTSTFGVNLDKFVVIPTLPVK